MCQLAVSVIEAADLKLSTTKYIMRCNSTEVYWVKRRLAIILFGKGSLKLKIQKEKEKRMNSNLHWGLKAWMRGLWALSSAISCCAFTELGIDALAPLRLWKQPSIPEALFWGGQDKNSSQNGRQAPVSLQHSQREWKKQAALFQWSPQRSSSATASQYSSCINLMAMSATPRKGHQRRQMCSLNLWVTKTYFLPSCQLN